jgi:DNA-binding SARP family transcriptional activator
MSIPQWILLGPVRIASGAASIEVGTGKQRGLLAALLLSPGRPVHADTLVDRLWDGEPPRSANPLAPYASRLRRILEPVFGRGVLGYRSGGYLLAAEPGSVDLHRARRQCRSARGSGVDLAAELLAEAVRGWPEEALAGVPGSWAARVRADLGEERLAAHAELGRALIRLGRPDEAIVRLNPLADRHPTAEDLAAVLVTALTEVGRPAAAMRRFARTRDAVAAAFGCHPSAALIEACKPIANEPRHCLRCRPGTAGPHRRRGEP